jgi:hypothetical protein
LTLPLAGIVMVGLAGRKMSKHSAIAGLCVSLVLLGLLIACGGGSTPPPVVGVTVSGTPTSLFPNNTGWSPVQTAQFTATVTNASNTAVTWSLTATGTSCPADPTQPSICGSLSSKTSNPATYTAPTLVAGLPGSVTVTATSQDDPTKTAMATVTIKPPTVPGSYPLTVTATEGPTQNTTAKFTLTVQ